MRVCAIAAPKGFGATLSRRCLTRVRFTAKASADCDLFIAFVRSRRELAAHLVGLARDITRQTLWIAWPKKASGVKTDLDGNWVRRSGLRVGLGGLQDLFDRRDLVGTRLQTTPVGQLFARSRRQMASAGSTQNRRR